MITINESVLQDMVNTILDETSPEEIILFGSHARGSAEEHSDVDLLVVESGAFGKGRSRRDEMTRLWLALSRFQVPKDILVYTRDEVENRRHSVNHIVGRALREGRVIYAQS